MDNTLALMGELLDIKLTTCDKTKTQQKNSRILALIKQLLAINQANSKSQLVKSWSKSITVHKAIIQAKIQSLSQPSNQDLHITYI